MGVFGALQATCCGGPKVERKNQDLNCCLPAPTALK